MWSLLARDELALRDLVDEIVDKGGCAYAVQADVTSLLEMQQLALQTTEQFGGFDSWIHCAAISQYSTVEDTTPQEFMRVMEVNFLGSVHGVQAAIPHLHSRGGGAFIDITSIEARRALPFQSAYSASKHATDAMLEALRVELKKEGAPIVITSVLPASINTPLFSKARSKLKTHPAPMPPVYSAESVANIVCYACEHPSRDLIAGGAGKLVLWSQRISPALFDSFWVRFGFGGQASDRSNIPNDNYYEPMHEFNCVDGSFKALSHSAYNFIQTHNPVRSGIEMLSQLPKRSRNANRSTRSKRARKLRSAGLIGVHARKL